ncbi:MAG: hypothetical protein RL023_263 [Candidatus Parcubacteria bacterium]
MTHVFGPWQFELKKGSKPGEATLSTKKNGSGKDAYYQKFDTDTWFKGMQDGDMKEITTFADMQKTITVKLLFEKVNGVMVLRAPLTIAAETDPFVYDPSITTPLSLSLVGTKVDISTIPLYSLDLMTIQDKLYEPGTTALAPTPVMINGVAYRLRIQTSNSWRVSFKLIKESDLKTTDVLLSGINPVIRYSGNGMSDILLNT